MVKQPAPVHGVQGLQGHLPGMTVPGEAGIAQQKNQIVGCGELGRRAKPSPPLIKALGKLADRLPDEFPARCAGLVLRFLPQMGGEGFPCGQHPRPILPPQAGRLIEQVQELVFGKIGAHPKGLLLWGEQHRQRPAPGAVHEVLPDRYFYLCRTGGGVHSGGGL